MVFHGDDGVLQIGGYPIERDVATTLIERKPWAAIGAVKNGLSSPLGKLVDGDGMSDQPRRARHYGEKHDSTQGQNDEIPLGAPPTNASPHRERQFSDPAR